MSPQLALIVEDDGDLATIFAEALEVAGFATEIAQDGETALAWLEHNAPDVVVLDLHLPRLSGADILRRIRADERLMDTRVIIATADPREAEPLQGDADLTLIKPISFSQLRNLATRLSTPASPGE